MIMVNILLVEDNSVDAELFVEAFTDACECEPSINVASDGEEALRIIRSAKKPALILLDLNLPKIGGLEVLKEIRLDDDPTISLIPVIIFTNSKMSQDVRRAYRHRCNAFVRKPIGYPKLLEMARKLNHFWCQCAILPNRNTPVPPSS
jgi:CheY-like chemotaxis protein